MISLDEIALTKDLETLFKKIVRNSDIIKQIRNFGPLDYKIVEGYLHDPKVIAELEKYGRRSILKKYYISQQNK
ncbi:uncharacterized protein VNE69_04076 [Vairimorpha necatrix]|uniref:Uncharacterized protein n=1 Tax=Vairimorpha necatrix TaxID=6039 RepID=A0AAX4JBD0_9MICR